MLLFLITVVVDDGDDDEAEKDFKDKKGVRKDGDGFVAEAVEDDFCRRPTSR